MAEYADDLMDHNYDGIQEFDNPLPGWWKMLFTLTIVVSPIYMFYYHAESTGRRIIDDYDTAVAENLRQQFAEIGELKPDAATILEYQNNAQWIKVGESVYKANCASCHGGDGLGLVGPNLCDDYYKHVKKVEDIATVVQNGAAGQAMPAWKNRLHPNEVVLVSSYVAKMRGSKPGGKPQFGELIPLWKTK